MSLRLARPSQAPYVPLLVAVNLLIALLVGVAVGAGHTMVAVLCVGALVVVAPSLSLAQWCVLLLATTIAGRGVAAVLRLHSPAFSGLR